MAPILFFDGVCNLCCTWVDFVLEHEAPTSPQSESIHFSSLQSPFAIKTLSLDPNSPLTTLVFRDSEGNCFFQSDAVLKVAQYLRAPWSLISAFRIFPKSLRDFLYNVVSRFRFQLFGKRSTCRIPSASEKSRFLEQI